MRAIWVRNSGRFRAAKVHKGAPGDDRPQENTGESFCRYPAFPIEEQAGLAKHAGRKVIHGLRFVLGPILDADDARHSTVVERRALTARRAGERTRQHRDGGASVVSKNRVIPA